jgi:diguanylate cyclase (GGDEF)-like protein/PAS domain S-box-containing protein
VLVVTGLSLATWRVAQDAADTARWVEHTHDVIHGLDQVRHDTLQIEFSTQGFRITGDTARLAERDAAVAEREAALVQLRRLTQDNTAQQERWRQLRQVLDVRLAISRRVEQLRKTLGGAAANAYAATAPLQETRQRTYQLIDDMKADELQLLEERDGQRQAARTKMVVTGALVSFLLLLVLSTTYSLIRRQLRETEASQRALAASEQNLAVTLHSIGDGVLVTDTRSRIRRMNPVAEQLTGWSQAEALGRPIETVFRIVHETTREPAEIPVGRALASGEIQGLANHTVLLARDGREIPIADSAAPIRDAKDEIEGVVLVFRDVSTERQAQRLVEQQNELLNQRVLERTSQLRETEDHLRGVINGAPTLIAYVDTAQRYVYANTLYCRRFARDGRDITGLTIREVVGEERYALASEALAQALQGAPQSFDWQPFPDVWQQSTYIPRRDADGHIAGCYILGLDITERKLAETQIQQLNTQLARRIEELEHVSRALRTLSAGNRALVRATEKLDLLNSMCEVITSSGGYRYAAVWYCNDDVQHSMRLMAQNGYPEGFDALTRLKPSWADNERGRSVIGSAVRNGQTVVARDLDTNPAYSPWRPYLFGVAAGIACPLFVGGKVIGVLSIYSDEADAFAASEVSLLEELAGDMAFGIATMRARMEQRRTEEAMRTLTYFDTLTGLPNATQFSTLLESSIESHGQSQRSFAVLQTNIGRLSEINDALGFVHGDQLLRAFAARMRQAAPESATVVRLRGDEFAVLLPDSDAESALALAQRLEEALAQPFPIADIPLDISVTIGIVLYPQHGTTPHDLYRHMDIAMRQARQAGNTRAIYDPALSHILPSRLSLASELRRAIDQGDLQLYLQPKVHIASGRVHGAEGLVRWQHASRGMIPPAEFIGLAEQTGLIRPLTDWVMEAGLRTAHALRSRGIRQPIAVNLSARNLRDEHLPRKVQQLQDRLGDLGGLLELEITETAVMEDAEYALRILNRLHEVGVRLYIDDFGTGYSSLSYLQKLPVDYIKIDQSFVRALSNSKDSSIIVRTTIDLAHDIGRQVVAEGVETREHWDQLAAYGCDLAQGYFIARPMAQERFEAWLQQFRPPA